VGGAVVSAIDESRDDRAADGIGTVVVELLKRIFGRG
jgi:hypothetical protein